MADNQNANKPDNTSPAPTKRKYTEMEIQRARQRRDVAIKKRRQAIKNSAPDSRDRLFIPKVDNTEAEKPKTLKDKWKNYWYHYKWATIGGAFALFTALFFAHDLLTKEDFDIVIPVVAANYQAPSSFLDAEDQLELVINDSNDNGKIDTLFELIQYDIENAETTDYNIIMAAQMKYMTSLSENTSFAFIVDEPMYKDLTETLGVDVIDLTTISDDDRIEGDRFYIKNSSMFEEVFDMEGLFLVMRDIESVEEDEREEVRAQYEYELSVVKEILEYK